MGFWSKLRNSFSLERQSREIDEELRFHLDMSARERGGERPARLRFGSPGSVREETREAGLFRWLDSLRQDLRYTCRALAGSPAFSVTAITSIALGIAATTVVFSFLYALLLNPFPYQGANRMFWVGGGERTGPTGPLLLSPAEFIEVQRMGVVDDAIATMPSIMAVGGGALSQAVPVERVSVNTFDYFGVPPLLGRTFTKEDMSGNQGSGSVVVLSYRFWQRHFGGDAGALGAVLRVEGRDYEVVGILPQRFMSMFNTTEILLPLPSAQDLNARMYVQVRIEPNVMRGGAEAALQQLFVSLANASPGRFPGDFRVQFKGLREARGDTYTGTLAPLLVVSALLLVVGCLNVSILLLARGTSRQAELATRKALGASKGRLVRQLLTESIVLGAVGGAIGIVLASWAVPAVLAVYPQYLPPDTVVRLSGPVLAFAAIVVLLTTLAFGLSPAFRLSCADMNLPMEGNSRAASSAVHRRPFYPVLIVGQVALTVVLLAAGGAAWRTFQTLSHVELGYDAQHILRLALRLPDGHLETWAERARFSNRLREQIAETPGVDSVAVGQVPPFAGGRMGILLSDRPPSDDQVSLVQRVSHEYFSTLRIPLARGRLWSSTDDVTAAPVAVINQAMARRFWPGVDPVGKRIRIPGLKSTAPDRETAPWLDVVGVVGDTPNTGLREPPSPMIYLPNTLLLTANEYLVIRTHGDPGAMFRMVERKVQAVDASTIVANNYVPSPGSNTAVEILRDIGWGRERLVASLSLAFASVALALAAVGLYGVVSYVVRRRQRECAIRIALGAPRAAVIGMIVGSTMRAVAVGLALGVLLSLGMSRMLMLWSGGTAPDPALFLSVGVVLLTAASIAALIPARHAATVDPLAALRCE
jgi:predicted permease